MVATESLGCELAKSILALHALKAERQEAMRSFKLREQAILDAIDSLADDVVGGQTKLYEPS